MKEHGDTCPPYRLGLEDVARICYGAKVDSFEKPPPHNVPSKREGIESTDKRTSLDIAREAAHEIMACFVPSSQWDRQYLGNITGIIQRCIEEATESSCAASLVQEPVKSESAPPKEKEIPNEETIDSLCRKAGLGTIQEQHEYWRKHERMDE